MPRKRSLPKGNLETAEVNPTSVRWVLAIAEHRSFRGAAKALGVGHGSVSRRLRELEGSLGISLFERSRRGLKPTIAGAAFIQEAREAFAHLQRGELVI
jgi:DNA-binding transcriptional LysR family regulator